jgi:hypothetical protein
MKLQHVLQSRKFWASAIALAATAGLYASDQLTAKQANDALVLIVSVYTGSIALEDGLTGIFALWNRPDAPQIEPELDGKPERYH